MGTWGTALYSDDFASDLRGGLRDLIGQGLSSEQAVDRLTAENQSSLTDLDEAPVFWLAVAHTAWKLGRPNQRATEKALEIIKNGSDLDRWTDSKLRAKRQLVLTQIEADLRTEPPPAKHIRPRYVENNQWLVGEIIAFRLASGTWCLLRVIGHHVDKGGRFAIFELLDWSGPAPPDADVDLSTLPLRPPTPPWNVTRFVLGPIRRKQDIARFVQTRVATAPVQEPIRYTGVIFPHVDRQFERLFGLR